MMRDGRLPPRLVPAHDRRHRGAAFGLAVVIAGLAHLVRLGRAGFVFAREGVLALVDTDAAAAAGARRHRASRG